MALCWDLGKGHSLSPPDLLTWMTGAWSSAAMLSLPHCRERGRQHRKCSREVAREEGAGALTLLRAASLS